MICYLDFEANGGIYAQEIISIGAVAETGERFYSLVRPRNKLDHKIKELTGISQEEAEAAPTMDEVMEEFWRWIYRTTNSLFVIPTFCVFGNGDDTFLQTSITLNRNSATTKQRLIDIKRNLVDVSKQIARNFNRETISLISAYLTLRTDASEQHHNALEDAEMLKYVFNHAKEYDGSPIIKAKSVDMSYGKHKEQGNKRLTAKNRGNRAKQAIRQCPALLDEKYKIAFTAQKERREPINFQWIGAALNLVHKHKFKTAEQKLVAMETIYNAIQTGKQVNGWTFRKAGM